MMLVSTYMHPGTLRCMIHICFILEISIASTNYSRSQKNLKALILQFLMKALFFQYFSYRYLRPYLYASLNLFHFRNSNGIIKFWNVGFFHDLNIFVSPTFIFFLCRFYFSIINLKSHRFTGRLYFLIF